mmetsp:Transcript_21146/g.46603  ORF Transcript_21146/g.46603 Transcript_21146/m.46603 type:complete len:80 (-) Transcript_21146:1020-1259(-)
MFFSRLSTVFNSPSDPNIHCFTGTPIQPCPWLRWISPFERRSLKMAEFFCVHLTPFLDPILQNAVFYLLLLTIQDCLRK